LIAACTAALDPPRREPDARLDALADQLTFVEQTEEDAARLKTRLEHIQDKRLRRIVTRQIARLAALPAAELQRIVKALQRHPDLAGRLELVLSVPGIGERTAIAIVLRMPELGPIGREAAAALAGLAPFDDDSGRHKGQRHIAGGRARLRRSLYAAALPAACRWNPALTALYARLIQAGKLHKRAGVACARKLFIYADTLVTRGTPWTERPAQS
jgi:transposase